jgi:hypothetical protein
MLKVSNTLFDTLGHSWDDLIGKRLQHDRAFYIVQVYAGEGPPECDAGNRDISAVGNSSRVNHKIYSSPKQNSPNGRFAHSFSQKIEQQAKRTTSKKNNKQKERRDVCWCIRLMTLLIILLSSSTNMSTMQRRRQNQNSLCSAPAPAPPPWCMIQNWLCSLMVRKIDDSINYFALFFY